MYLYMLYMYLHIEIIDRDNRKNLNNLIINIYGYLIINDKKNK